jgi:Protein of unknown function (DUF2735)
MAMNPNDGSAKIYHFPTGGRAAVAERRSGETKPTIGGEVPCLSETICSGSWYHEEAIQESKSESRPGREH